MLGCCRPESMCFAPRVRARRGGASNLKLFWFSAFILHFNRLFALSRQGRGENRTPQKCMKRVRNKRVPYLFSSAQYTLLFTL